jgi:hypothetical protein
VIAERGEIRLVGVDVEREREPLVGQAGKLDQRPQRVSLLAVTDAVVLDRAVGAEVRDGREGVRVDPICDRPAVENHGRQGRDPVVPGRRHPAADGDVVRMAVEPHVHPLQVPELVEDRVEVEVDPDRRSVEDALVAEHPGDVQEQVGHRPGVRPEERLWPEIELGKVRTCIAARLGRIDDPDFVSELLEPPDVLEHRPGGAALTWVGGDHARDQDPHRASSSIAASTTSESKCCSAIARAARAWRTWSSAIARAPAAASSSVPNATRPSPDGSVRVKPVSWRSTGLPEAR